MKNRVWGALSLLGLCLLFIGVALAVDPRQAPDRKPVPAPRPAPLDRADLLISWIQAWPCACEELTATVDSLIVKGPIIVRVANAGPQAAEARVFITFRDRNRSWISEITKNIHLNAHGSMDIVIDEDASPTHPILLAKSLGIEATVSPTTPGLIDPNSANNKKKITACNYVIE